jgi:hypothetical protein
LAGLAAIWLRLPDRPTSGRVQWRQEVSSCTSQPDPWLRGRFSSHSEGISNKGTGCNRTSAVHTVMGFWTCLFPALILLCWPQPCFVQTSLQQQVQNIQDRAATITVNVRFADHSPVEPSVIINLRTFDGVSLGAGSMRVEMIDFSNLPVGRYTVEVIAAGYQRTTEDVEIYGRRPTAGGGRRTAAGSERQRGQLSQPTSDPRADAQKELSRALDERNNKPQEAKKYLDKVSRSAPGNPDVSYSWGLYYEQVRNLTKANSYWEKTIQIYLRHAFALAALGQMARQDRDQASAIGYFERAAEAAPSRGAPSGTGLRPGRCIF